MSSSVKLPRTAPAAERNKDPILAVLRRALPKRGLVLEIASGTGQHVVHFAQALPSLDWQPSDPDPEARSSIVGWTAHRQAPNVLPPLDLNVSREVWPIERADAVVCINMIHISPRASTLHLLAGAARILPAGGVLFLYGPFRRQDQQTAPSNEAFDAQLRRQNPEWGLRHLDQVIREANINGLGQVEITEMPANNLSVVLRRSRSPARPKVTPLRRLPPGSFFPLTMSRGWRPAWPL